MLKLSLWQRIYRPAVIRTGGRSAVFLDLQGTLGGDGLGHALDFTFFPAAIPAVRAANEAGLPCILVTNQSRIAAGWFTLAQFAVRMDELQAELEIHGAHWDAVYCCPHSRDDGCTCCKPLPGMLQQAARDFDLHLPDCALIGDTGAWDVLAARAAGCRAVLVHTRLVRTGLGESSLDAYRYLWADVEADAICADVLEAVQWVIGGLV